tara:strand:- start:207 stop:743 length:537 start_codon:yes stop_codon:yes gene_type:complete
MIKIINNVISLPDSFHLYEGLLKTNMWSMSMSSEAKMGGKFPGVTLIRDSEVVCNQTYWIGYLNCLLDRINQKLYEQHKFLLKRNIDRLLINAQNQNHYTEFHADTYSSSTYSVIGFLTPQWSEDWGGELVIEGETIQYKPGDFVLFDSEMMHTSQKIKKDIPYWRMTINYVVKKSDA